jgi:hypothetical protein
MGIFVTEHSMIKFFFSFWRNLTPQKKNLAQKFENEIILDVFNRHK